MNKKLSNIEEGLKQIEELDTQIKTLLDEQKYGEIIKLMPQRMSIISQITYIKDQEGISDKDQKQLEEIFSGANNIQNTVIEKKDKINSRLKKHKTTVTQNKKLRY